MNLYPRKEFDITLKKETYRGKFGTYAYKLFCNKKQIKLKDVNTYFPDDTETIDILDAVIDLIICAIESTAERQRKKVDLQRVDFWDAVDEKEISNDDLINIFNHAADEETKNVKLGPPQAGMNSSDISMQPEESQMNSGE